MKHDQHEQLQLADVFFFPSDEVFHPWYGTGQVQHRRNLAFAPDAAAALTGLRDSILSEFLSESE